MVKNTHRSCWTVLHSTVVDNSGRALKIVGHIPSVINQSANNLFAPNGLAERVVQSFKSGFEKMGEGRLNTKLARFLLQHRNAPQSIACRVVDGSTTKITSRSPAPTFVAEGTAKATLSNRTRSTCTVIEYIHETSVVNLTCYRVS